MVATVGPAVARTTAVNGSHNGALAVLATIFFMWGFVTVLNDVLIPHLKSVFDLTYTATLLIQFVFFGTYFLMALPGAKLIEGFGYRRSIAIGLAITGVGAAGFIPAATLPSYPLFLGALFVLAAGITVLQVAANPYVAVIGPPQTASSRLNLVQAFNSLGTAVAPTFGGMLILANTVGGTSSHEQVLSQAQRAADALAVRWPYAGIALLLLVLAVVIYLWPLPPVPTEDTPDDRVNDSVWRHRRLVLGLAAIFTYVGAEIAVGSFLINYISGPTVGNMSHADSAFYVTLFWSGAMAGRFVGSGLMRVIPPWSMLAIQSIAATLLILLSISTSGTVAIWTIVLVGLMNSIMFPTIFALAIEGLGHLTQRGSGLLIMAIVGGAIVPLIQAVIADAHGIRLAFLVPAACYLCVLYFALACRPAARY
ncbi:sugar MFS transporter [Steroidobacter flavus]|uniref:Sugar MFS transporter n=1 Tax=Steroidobacter flavus TaxID=1842136 RepID=A0ABV8T097_9GAMM